MGSTLVGHLKKQFVDEESLLNDSYRLAVKIFESDFRPNYIIGLWRGGSTVGIYVQECLQYLGVETDHIAIRTSYRGREDYVRRFDTPDDIRVHGLQYLYENLNNTDSLLIVDDVFSTGRNINALLNRLKSKTKRNMPDDIRIAVPFFRPSESENGATPHYFLHETDNWLVLPYELTGLTHDEIVHEKKWLKPPQIRNQKIT